MSLKNKVALVTGASSGIGAAIAKLFSQEGARVAIIGRNEAKLNSVAADCAKFGNQPLTVKADVSNENDAERIINRTIESFGKLDVLVNNAGLNRLGALLSKDVLKAYDETMNTNIRAIVHLTHLAANHLIKSKGNVINTSSILGKTAPSDYRFMPYCVSKAAVDHFTRCAAAELASKGVRVNAINPGPVFSDIVINTGFNEEAAKKVYDHMKRGTALGRISGPEEIAELVLFLASDKAKGITGSSFVTDNGVMLQSN